MQYSLPDLTQAHGETITGDQPSQGQEASHAMKSPQLLNWGTGHMEEMHTMVGPTDRRTWVTQETLDLIGN